MTATCLECRREDSRRFRRGLCPACYMFLMRHGGLDGYPPLRVTYDSGAVTEDYLFIKAANGGTVEQIAARLSINPKTLRGNLGKQGVRLR